MNTIDKKSLTLFQDNRSIYQKSPLDQTAAVRFRVLIPLLLAENPVDILDVGCGQGAFLRLVPDSIRRSGIDCISPDEVPDTIDYRQQDLAQGLPWGDGIFDVVVAGEVIEHQVDTVSFLLECRRVLRPGGSLLLTTPNLAYWRNVIQWFRKQQFYFIDHRAGENGHVRYFAPCTAEKLLIECGFTVEKLFSVGDLPTSKNRFLILLGSIIQYCCSMRNLSLVVKAKRY
jgi:2-polyprenyl-3-methyl-5-hydroxy-6-metoxy-1,4-benzoquinol methylase